MAWTNSLAMVYPWLNAVIFSAWMDLVDMVLLEIDALRHRRPSFSLSSSLSSMIFGKCEGRHLASWNQSIPSCVWIRLSGNSRVVNGQARVLQITSSAWEGALQRITHTPLQYGAPSGCLSSLENFFFLLCSTMYLGDLLRRYALVLVICWHQSPSRGLRAQLRNAHSLYPAQQTFCDYLGPAVAICVSQTIGHFVSVNQFWRDGSYKTMSV